MTKTENESPADRVKREQAEKEAAAKAASEKGAPEKAAPEKAAAEAEKGGETKMTPEEEALEKEKKERFARAEAFEKERQAKLDARFNQVEAAAERNSSQSLVNDTKGSAGMDKLHRIAQSLPPSTPNEHVLFGLGGVRFTAGDLRDAVGMRRT